MPLRLTRLWPIAALLLAGFFGWMAFVPGGPEVDDRAIAAAQAAASAQAAQASTSNPYVTVPIQDIRKGDYVLATDPKTGEQAPRKVIDAFSRVVNRLRILEVRTESGRIETIRTTDEHPFWVDDTEDFLPAGDLEPGDSFHGPTGEKNNPRLNPLGVGSHVDHLKA